MAQMIKNLLTGQETRVRSIPGSGKSPGEGNGNPLQYSCPENSMDRGAWRAIYSPRGHKELDTTEQLTQTNTHAIESHYIPFSTNSSQPLPVFPFGVLVVFLLICKNSSQIRESHPLTII